MDEDELIQDPIEEPNEDPVEEQPIEEEVPIDESIMKTICKMAGDNPAFSYYNTDLMVFINSALGILQSIGIGNPDFVVTSANDKWTDFATIELSLIKAYVYCQVKIDFDPPQASYLIDAIQKKKDELQYRLQVTYSNLASSSEPVEDTTN